MSYSQLTLLGHVGRDPEFKDVAGKQVCNFSLAINRRVKGQQVSVWFDIACWNERTNAVIRDFVIKGSQVMVQGEPSMRVWSKQGEPAGVMTCDISWGSLTLCGARADRVPDRVAEKPAAQRQPAIADDDIPF